MEKFFINNLNKIQSLALEKNETIHVSKNSCFQIPELKSIPTPSCSFRVTTKGDIWVLLPGDIESFYSVKRAYSPTLGIFNIKKPLNFEMAKNNVETNSDLIVPIMDVAKVPFKKFEKKISEIAEEKFSLISKQCDGTL